MVALILNVPDLFLLTYYFLEFLMPFSLLWFYYYSIFPVSFFPLYIHYSSIIKTSLTFITSLI